MEETEEGIHSSGILLVNPIIGTDYVVRARDDASCGITCGASARRGLRYSACLTLHDKLSDKSI